MRTVLPNHPMRNNGQPPRLRPWKKINPPSSFADICVWEIPELIQIPFALSTKDEPGHLSIYGTTGLCSTQDRFTDLFGLCLPEAGWTADINQLPLMAGKHKENENSILIAAIKLSQNPHQDTNQIN